MNVVTCWNCTHVFGQDEDENVAKQIAGKTREKYRLCPKCGKPLEISVGWASGLISDPDVTIEMKVGDDIPDLEQLLADKILPKQKKKKWWQK